MTPQRVTLIRSGVADLDRARAVCEALGWRPAEAGTSLIFYRMHGAARRRRASRTTFWQILG
jgi:hypothetical protein